MCNKIYFNKFRNLLENYNARKIKVPFNFIEVRMFNPHYVEVCKEITEIPVS